MGECRLDMEELLGMQQDASVFSANATATAGPRRLQRRWSMPVLSPSAIHGLQEINASTHTPVPTPVRPNRISWPRNRLRQRMRSKTEASSREPSARCCLGVMVIMRVHVCWGVDGHPRRVVVVRFMEQDSATWLTGGAGGVYN